MEVYTQHRRRVAQLLALIDEMNDCSSRLERLAASQRKRRFVRASVERSAEWLQVATHSLLMSVVALRDAVEMFATAQADGEV